MPVYLLATLDTKGQEMTYVRDRLAEQGVACVLVDCGCLGEPGVVPDISREQVCSAGSISLAELREKRDRSAAVASFAAAAAALIQLHFRQGKVDGVLGIGGSAGTTIATTAMRGLPLGVPKLMVSTMASGNTRGFVGDKDILMLNSIVDIAGLNRISRVVLAEAAAAMAGLVRASTAQSNRHGNLADGATEGVKGTIAATMFGVTTPCVTRAREVLEAAGFEVLVFHATGSGGQAMESLIRDGMICGVLDITTTELADELVGGVLSAGPTRLTAAAELGVPQVVSVGATDMVNFHAPNTVPECFRDRQFYQHNANVTLMRTTIDENRQIGAEIGRKLAAAKGPTVGFLPRQGVSAIDRAGQPFNNPQARSALFAAIRENSGDTELVELDEHINDPEFAESAANRLLKLIATSKPVEPTPELP